MCSMIWARTEQTASTSTTMGSSGSPSFTSIASNANGFVFGNQVAGSPYTTGAPMNAGNGNPCDYPISGGNGTCGSSTNQLGRIDIAVAPVIQITSTRKRNPSFGITMAVAEVQTVASLVHGLPQMAAQAPVIWKALKAVRYETARISRVTIRKTGTIRESLLTQMTPTASSSTLLTSGLQREQGQYGTIQLADIPTPAAQARCTWTSTRSRFYRALRVFWRLGMMAACMERQTQTLQRKQSIRPGLTWIQASTRSSSTPATSAVTLLMLLLPGQVAGRKTTARRQ